MNKKLFLALFIGVAALASGCASVSGSPNQSISVQTRDQNGEDVAGANCELYNNKGKWLVVTPGSTTVHKSNQDMQVSCTKEGMEPGKLSLESKTLGSMYGNIILGGGVGAIIDHNSGAAYEYPAVIRVSMRALSNKDAAGKGEKTPANASGATVTAVAQPVAPLPAANERKLTRMAKSRDKNPQVGDEWEYLAEDKLFGKQKRLLWRVKSVDTSGVLEELVVDGRPGIQWLFSNKPDLIGAPIDTGFIFGQHWDTQSALPRLSVSGVSECVHRFKCSIDAKMVGYEQITIAAGTFDAVRIDGIFTISPQTIPDNGTVSFWYSEKDRRLLKQVATLHSNRLGFVVNESIELQMARAYQ